MFTGLVTAVGTVEASRAMPEGGRRLTIKAPYRGLAIGESVAVNGACLTIETKARGRFVVHAVATTLGRTLFGSYGAGHQVNLERALRVGDRLGGHWVQGHVDGIGTVTAVRPGDDAWLVDIRVPPAVAAVTVPLGSLAVDGVSLTVNAIRRGGQVQVALIPHTRRVTTLGTIRVGQRVQLEGDLIGKYLAALTGRRAPTGSR